MKISEIIAIDPDVLFGTPVFRGTRVPVESFFWHIEQGITVDNFIEEFPSVSKEQAIHLLQLSEKILSTPQLIQMYDSAA